MILDAGERLGDSWRARWDSLRLYSPASRDGLPGMRFPARSTSYPTKDEMADYLEAYAARFELPVRSGTAVDTLTKEDGRYVATAGDLRFEADNVVVATGVFQKPHVPDFAGELDPSITQLHSQRLPEPLAAAGGAGARRRREPLGLRHRLRGGLGARGHPLGDGHRTAPGADREPPRTDAVPRARSSPARTSSPSTRRSAGRCAHTSGTAAGRSSATGGRTCGAAGVERVLARTVGVEDGLPVLDDGRVLDVANVVWCTGFRPDSSWIRLPFEIGDDGYPVQYRGVVSSSPGLYFVGLPFLHSFASMLIGGAGRDAERVARHIVTERTAEHEARVARGTLETTRVAA